MATCLSLSVLVYHLLFFSFLTFYVSASPVALSIRNTFTRVDDADPRFTYGFNWRALNKADGSFTCPSTECFSSGMDPESVFQGTWHEADGKATVTYTFSGVGVVAYGVLSDNRGARTSLTFLLDGAPVSTYFRQGGGGGDGTTWLYNFPLLELTGLPLKQYTLTIVQDAESRFILDYLEVEQLGTESLPTPISTSSPSDPSMPVPRDFSASQSTKPTASFVSVGVQASPSLNSAGVIPNGNQRKGLPAGSIAVICIALLIVASAVVAAALYLKRAKPRNIDFVMQNTDRSLTESTSIPQKLSKFLSPPPSANSVYKLPPHLGNSVHTLNASNELDDTQQTNRHGAPSLNVAKNYNGIPPSLAPSRSRNSLSAASSGSRALAGRTSVTSSNLQVPPSQVRGVRPLEIIGHSPSLSLTSTLVGPPSASSQKELHPPPRSKRYFPSFTSRTNPVLSITVPSPALSIDYSQTSLAGTPLAAVIEQEKANSKPRLELPVPDMTALSPSGHSSSSRRTSLSSFWDLDSARLSKWKEKATVMLGRREVFDWAYAFAGPSAQSSSEKQPQNELPPSKLSRSSHQTFGHSLN